MPEKSDHLRASDADRQRVADLLKTALDEGRLSLDEYDQRLRDTYAAKTYGDLKPPLADLPPVATAAHAQVQPSGDADLVEAQRRNATRKWVYGMWSSWISTGLIVTAIWFATWIGGGGPAPYFWPIWVIGPWGAVLLASTIGGLTSGQQPRREWDRYARRAARREARRRYRGR